MIEIGVKAPKIPNALEDGGVDQIEIGPEANQVNRVNHSWCAKGRDPDFPHLNLSQTWDEDR